VIAFITHVAPRRGQARSNRWLVGYTSDETIVGAHATASADRAIGKRINQLEKYEEKRLI